MPNTRTDRLRPLDLSADELESLYDGLLDGVGGLEWRRRQLAEQIVQAPLSPNLVSCPCCGGGGDSREPRGCRGACCQVCAFCMGRRFFGYDELASSSPFVGGTLERIAVEYWRTPKGLLATQSDQLFPAIEFGIGGRPTMTIPPARALGELQRRPFRKKATLLLVDEDLELLWTLAERNLDLMHPNTLSKVSKALYADRREWEHGARHGAVMADGLEYPVARWCSVCEHDHWYLFRCEHFQPTLGDEIAQQAAAIRGRRLKWVLPFSVDGVRMFNAPDSPKPDPRYLKRPL